MARTKLSERLLFLARQQALSGANPPEAEQSAPDVPQSREDVTVHDDERKGTGGGALMRPALLCFV